MEIDAYRPLQGATPVNTQRIAESLAATKNEITLPGDKENNPMEAEGINTRAVTSKNDKSDEKTAEKAARMEAEASDKMLKTAVNIANEKLKSSQRMLQCSMHAKTKRMMVKVVDTDTNEIIREIPPEKTLDLFARVLEMAGILLNERK